MSAVLRANALRSSLRATPFAARAACSVSPRCPNSAASAMCARSTLSSALRPPAAPIVRDHSRPHAAHGHPQAERHPQQAQRGREQPPAHHRRRRRGRRRVLLLHPDGAAGRIRAAQAERGAREGAGGGAPCGREGDRAGRVPRRAREVRRDQGARLRSPA